jgi:predicted RNase H-like nuclease
MEALATNRRCCSDRKGISQQAFHIRERIRAVDDLLTPALQAKVREGHPEVTFAVMNGGRPMKHHKRTPEGLAERLTILAAFGVNGFDPIAARAHLGKSRVEIDDIVDAVAMLVTAKRIVEGRATAFPDGPACLDDRGLEMRIWA